MTIEKVTRFNSQLMDFLKDPEVKEIIINKLKNAKYILPTVKQAFIDFFTTKIKIYRKDDETEEEEIVDEQLPEKIAKEYINALNNIPSSPIDEYLNNVVATLRSKGINISLMSGNIAKLVSDLAKVGNMESFNYDSNTEEAINQALDIIELALVGLESAKTSINGNFKDLFGFNATINEIREKRKTKTRDSKATNETQKEPRKLALIDSDIATLM